METKLVKELKAALAEFDARLIAGASGAGYKDKSEAAVARRIESNKKIYSTERVRMCNRIEDAEEKAKKLTGATEIWRLTLVRNDGETVHREEFASFADAYNEMAKSIRWWSSSGSKEEGKARYLDDDGHVGILTKE